MQTCTHIHVLPLILIPRLQLPLAYPWCLISQIEDFKCKTTGRPTCCNYHSKSQNHSSSSKFHVACRKCLVMNTSGYVIVYLHTSNDLFIAKSDPFIPFDILDDKSDPVDCGGSQGHNMRKYCCFSVKILWISIISLFLVFFECLG